MKRISDVAKNDCQYLENGGVTGNDIIRRFLSRLQNLTNTDVSNIDVEDGFLIKKIREQDMTGAYELGNDDVRFLIEIRHPETFADLVKICAIAHGADICHNKSSEGYEPFDLEIEWAEEKMKYSMMAAWYKLNYPQEFYQAYFEIYVCDAE